MHSVVKIDIPHVTEAKVYLENGAIPSLHVWTKLSSADTVEVATLNSELKKRLGGKDGYAMITLHLTDKASAYAYKS